MTDDLEIKHDEKQDENELDCQNPKEPLLNNETRSWIGEFVIGIGEAITRIGQSLREKGSDDDQPQSY